MRLATLFSLFFLVVQLSAQRATLPDRANLVFGVGQIMQGGFNIEGNLFYNRLAFDYSHGVSLSVFNDQLEEGSDKMQGLDIHLPWTTGFGLGYRFNDWLNLRVEPKWHKFELYYQDSDFTSENLIADYTTFTLGLGLYANWLPFKNQNNFLKGIMIAPNVRWWPKISSSLEGGQLSYFNQLTEAQETHQARQIGLANTAFFYNISVGYSIKF